jgi:hypothetical protein
MCTGLEIAGMLAGPLLSTAGSFIQQSEQEANNRRMADARNEKLRVTMAKNDSLADQSRAEYNARQQKASADQIETDRQQKTAERSDTLEQAVQEAPKEAAGVSLSGSAPTVVKSELAKRMAAAMGQATESAKAQAKLGGYGDTWLDQGFQDVTAGRNIAQNANFASGNLSILPYQQDIAEMRAYKPISPIGGLLQGFGGMLSSYGGSGGVPKKSYKSPAWV